MTRRSNRLAHRSSSPSRNDGINDKSTEGRRSLRSPLRKLQSTRAQETTTPNSLQSLTGAQRSPSRRLSSIGSAETSGDDEDAIISKPVRRQRATKSAADDPFVIEDDEVEYISSDKEVSTAKPQPKSSRKNKREIDDFIVPEDEVEYITSDEEIFGAVGTPNRHRRDRRVPKKSARKSRKEQEELEEDLLDLQDSDQENAVQKSRTRGGPVTTQRDRTREHFERLKRQRAGERMSRIIDSDDEIYEAYGSDDDGVDIDDIGREPNRVEILSDNSSEPSLIGAPDNADLVEGDTQTVIEEGEDDFVVDDEGINTGRHGRPHPDIPLEFTKFASAKPKELFIHIIEWMVKNKISPAFSRDDGVYTMSFSRIDDQVKAQAGSRLISSAWSATFKHAILARPSMKVRALPGLDEDNIRTCDACNRTNHPARYDFKFSGQPYHKDTLEPIEEDEDEEDREDEDAEQDNNHNNKAEYDDKGHLLASEHTHFYLGRFCAANAEMGHKLSHWKYHLNESVLSYLEEQRVLSPEAIVSRDKLNKKKREKEAEAIVDTMDETGMVQQLWQGFQDNLEDAKFGMEDHVRSGGRGKDRIGSVKIRMGGGRVGEWNEGGRYKEVTTIQSDSEGE